MTRRPYRPSLFWAFLICAPLLSGCTGRPGGLFGITQEGQKLLPVTKELRQAVPDPAPLPRELDKALHPPYVVEPGDVLLVQPAKYDSPAHHHHEPAAATAAVDLIRSDAASVP